MEKEASFFDRLRFDPALKNSFIARYFGSTRAILLIVFTLTTAGLATFFSLPKELNPDIQIPIVFVSTAYPGAGPEDIETLVTIPLEDAVLGLEGATKVTSSSRENFSTLSIEFSSGTDPQVAKNEVQNAIDSVTTLPEDAESSHAQVLDFQNQPVLTFLISGANDPETLSRLARELERRLDDLAEVEKTDQSYLTDTEVALFLRPEILRERDLSLPELARSIETALGNYPGGSLTSGGTTLALSQAPLIRTVSDLRSLPLDVGGRILSLGEVALIRETGAPESAPAYFATSDTPGTRAVFFSVFKREGVNADMTVASVEEAVRELFAEYETDQSFVYEPIFNGAEEIQKSFDQLFRDFLITFFLVFLVLLVFFGARQSVIASLAIPLTFLGVFLVMLATGISVNFIALFSLLIALGILVDNAIVIISAMASYHRTGKFTPEETALLVYRDFKTVIFTTTITTVWAFLPLLLATGIIGEFIKPIPILVSSSLAISAAIALFIVTPLMAVLMRGRFPRRVIIAFSLFFFVLGGAFVFALIPSGPAKPYLYLGALIVLALLVLVARHIRSRTVLQPQRGAWREKARALTLQGWFDFEPLSHRYAHLLERILSSKRARRKTFAMLLVFSLFSYALVPTGLVVNEFFPSDDTELVYVHLELAQGTTLERANAEVSPLLERLRTIPDTRFVFAEVGAAPPTDSFVSTGSAPHSVLFTLLLVPDSERERTSGEIVADLNRELANYERGEVAASQLSGGPPAGSDIEIKLLGKDLPTLEKFARNIEAYLRTQPGITDTSLSLESGLSKVVFIPRGEDLARLNMNEDETALLLRTLGSGFTVKENARFQDGRNEEVERDVVLRLSEPTDSLNTADDLGRLSTAQTRNALPLLALGDFVLEPNPALITREDAKRTLSVKAGVAEGYSVTTLNNELEKFADTLSLPSGYSWQTGGVNEENDKSVRSIMMAMLLSAVLIFATMAIQFNSFRQALAVLLVIPLAVSGVFIIFGLFGIPLSFPALIGVLALFGIVVNNSIIMVDKMNRNMQSGLPIVQAITEGAASRLEPILLTAFSTIVGLIPITLSDPIWEGLGGAIIAGLLFSGLVKLFFLPLIYYAFFGPKEEKTY